MEIIKRKKLELLQETILYYENNPRGMEGSSCKYITSDGNNCAAGRLFTDKALRIIEDKKMNENRLKFIVDEIPPEKLFKERYLWLVGEFHFLFRLQSLHDWLGYWDKDGLTEDGKAYAQNIEQEVKNGVI